MTTATTTRAFSFSSSVLVKASRQLPATALLSPPAPTIVPSQHCSLLLPPLLLQHRRALRAPSKPSRPRSSAAPSPGPGTAPAADGNNPRPVPPPMKTQPPLLGRHRVVPVDLFRINNTDKVVLRDYAAQFYLGRPSYDLVVAEDGMVHPRDGPNFEGPNGASVRPNGAFLQELVRNFRARNTVIYRLPEGLELPPELVILHEHTDHHSIQCTRPMTLEELNERVTELCKVHGERMSKNEFCERYPFTV